MIEIRKTGNINVDRILKELEELFKKTKKDKRNIRYAKHMLAFIKIASYRYKLKDIKEVNKTHINKYVKFMREKNYEDIGDVIRGILYFHSLIDKPRYKIGKIGDYINKEEDTVNGNRNLTEEEVNLLKCPYCNSSIKFVDSKVIYGKSYGMAYVCSRYPECDSYVGVHDGTNKPKGRLANKELRIKKKTVHAITDGFWRNNVMTRDEFYDWFSNLLNMSIFETHIGMFDIETCDKAIKLLREEKKLSLTTKMLDNIFKIYFKEIKGNEDILVPFEKEFMPKMKELQEKKDKVLLTERQQYYTYQVFDMVLYKIKKKEKELKIKNRKTAA